MLPTSSTETVQPSASHCALNFAHLPVEVGQGQAANAALRRRADLRRGHQQIQSRRASICRFCKCKTS
jgi:hypothetical protein